MADNSAAVHLNGWHKAEHDFHTKMIALHRAQLEKAESDEAKDFHRTSLSAHLGLQVFHSSGIAQTQKAMEGELEKSDRLIPTQVSAVYDPAKGPRPVIRPGQREINTAEMPKVDMQFEHLVKVDD
jgi:hypothetical protein